MKCIRANGIDSNGSFCDTPGARRLLTMSLRLRPGNTIQHSTTTTSGIGIGISDGGGSYSNVTVVMPLLLAAMELAVTTQHQRHNERDERALYATKHFNWLRLWYDLISLSPCLPLWLTSLHNMRQFQLLYWLILIAHFDQKP